MNLKSTVPHMKGQSVLVNGNRYKVGDDGIADKVKDKDAQKLLLSSAWKLAREPAKGKGKGKDKSKEPPPPPADDAGKDDETAKEWPAPTADMDLDYLREMAEAYDVPTTHNMKAETMVDRIKEARDLEE